MYVICGNAPYFTFHGHPLDQLDQDGMKTNNMKFIFLLKNECVHVLCSAKTLHVK
jgi:hypothetical protein